ncbi:MAG: hypothetical protein NT031_07455 [Planctomycetota bacterium]|nr:hypothetical protein [Planctomycetota bacterium]
MPNNIIVTAGIVAVVTLSGIAGGQQTQPAPTLFRSDVRMTVYVYDDGQDIPRELARELGRMPAAGAIEIPAGQAWEVDISAPDFAAAKDAVIAQLSDLGRRGLCPGVQLTDGATDADVEALAKVEGLKALAVDAGKITDKALATMAGVRGLREVRLTYCNRLTPGGAGALAALPDLSRLAVIDCSGTTNELIAKLRGSASLKRLALTGGELDARCLGDLTELKALESLKLWQAHWLRDEHLAKIAQMKSLTELNLRGSDGLRGRGLADLAALPNLRSFVTTNAVIYGHEGPAADDAWLEQLAKFPALRCLRLANCSRVTAAGLGKLRQLTGLEELELVGLEKENLTKDGQSGSDRPVDNALACLGAMTGLKSLALSGEFALTETMAAQIGRCSALERVSIEEATGVGDECLAAWSKLPNLWELRLDSCPEVTAKGVEHVAKLAKLRVLYLGGCERLRGADLAPLAALTNLEELDLQRATALTNDLSPLGKLTRLRVLVLYGCTGLEDGALAGLRTLTGLGELHIHGCDKLTDAGLADLAAMTGLHTLYLGGSKMGDGACQSIARLGNLRTLHAEGCGLLSDKGLACLAPLRNLTGLYVLDAESISGTGLASLAATTALRELELDGKGLTDEGLKAIGALQGLRSLRLSDCPRITDAGVQALGKLARLDSLTMPGADLVTDAGIAALEPLAELEALDLSATALTDKALESMAKLTNLRYLTLTAAGKITDAGLKALSRCKGLQTLDIAGNETCTGAGVGALAALPRLYSLILTPCPGLTDGGLADLAKSTALETLYLDGAGKISDAGVQALAAAPRLACLQLGQCEQITDLSLKALAGMASLESLTISSADKLTPAGVLKLADAPALRDLKPVDSDEVSPMTPVLTRVIAAGAAWTGSN